MVDSSPLFDLILTKSQFQSISIQQNDNFTEHLVNERTFLAWTRTSLDIFLHLDMLLQDRMVQLIFE
ncbi:unnamed protein product [Rotaria sordida]|uniref:DUF202 domain-containing protein n=1 Tax=Rotaria sordida TaxID=392033 RepID=A0A814VKJ3_9BILA|nr:unnamed protein product [Rotaria sordida]CAF3633076.1 unnamed protein product [Rotaria sordida]